MENTMTFLNIHFTWLEVLTRSLPRQRRLPRNLLPRQVLLLSFSFLPFLIIANFNNLDLAGDASIGVYCF